MRRFYAFLIMVFSVFAVVLFNVQGQYGLMNFGLEYENGTEYTYVITPDEANSRFDINEVAKEFSTRLENAGAKDYYVSSLTDEVIASDSNNETQYQIKVRLSGLESQQTNILRNIENFGDFWITTQDNKATANGEDIVRGSARIVYNGSSASVIVKTTDQFKEDVGSKLQEAVTEGEETSEGDKLIIWAKGYIEEVDSYEEAIKDQTALQKKMQEKIVAVLAGSSFNKDNNELTISAVGYVGTGTSTTGLNSQSAHSVQRFFNEDKVNYSIDRIYTRVLDANFGSKASMLVGISCIVLVLIITISLIVAFGINGLAGGTCVTLSSFLSVVFYNSFALSISPAFVISFLASVALSTIIVATYLAKFKNDLYKGRTPSKANKDTFKATLSTALDASVFTLIVSIILALISKNSVQNFFIFIIIAVIFDFIICLFLNRIMCYLIANSKVGEKLNAYRIKKDLIPDLAKSEEQKYFGKFASFDAKKHQKKSFITLLSLSLVSLVAVVIFSILPNTSTFAYSNEFDSYTVIEIVDTRGEAFTTNDDVKTFFKETINIEPFEVSIANALDEFDLEGEDKIYYIDAKFSQDVGVFDTYLEDIEAKLENDFNFVFNLKSDESYVDSISYYQVNPYASTHDFNNSMILIGITVLCAIVYCFIRFRYTFTLSSVVTTITSTLITIGILVLTRIPVSPNIGVSLLAASLVTTLLEFIVLERYGQLRKEHKSKIITKEDRYDFMKVALSQSLPILMVTTCALVLGGIVMLFVSPLQMYSLYLITILGIMIGLLNIVFIFAPLYIFSEKHLSIKKKEKTKEQKEKLKKKLEQKRKVMRTSKEIEEVIVPGIND